MRIPVAAALLVLGAWTPAQQEEGTPATVDVLPAELEMAVGDSVQLEVTVKDAAGEAMSSPTVLYLPEWGQFWNLDQRTWGFNLFKVSPDGLVTASKSGDYGVRVRVPVADGEFIDKLVPLRIVEPPITEINFVDPPSRFYEGTTVRMNVEHIDPTGARRDIDHGGFRTSDADLAMIDSHGNLTLTGTGSVTVSALADHAEATLEIAVEPYPGQRLSLMADEVTVRTGDVVQLSGAVLDRGDRPVPDAPITYSFNAVTPALASGGPSSGMVTPDGRFVADLPGEYSLLATSGGLVGRVTLTVTPRDASQPVTLVGHGRVNEHGTSDLWIWEGVDGRDYAVTGTHSGEGKAIFWDVTDPTDLQMITSVQVDARNVNDVKISEDGTVAVISREGASSRRNGIVILDVSAPHDGVEIIAEYDDQLTGGVHNLFVHDGHVYALSGGQRYDIINIEDPANPHRVGTFQLPNPDRSIHDVWVVDGVAYSANWNDGVVVVDVGGGDAGGSPRNPVMMDRVPFDTGWNHAVFPYRSNSTGKHYVFAGDEAARSGRFSPKPEVGTGTPGYENEPNRWRGWIHILEWDPTAGTEPHLVARYEVPEAGSHNIWVEDDLMYVAFYNGGLRVVDVSGELLGDLYRQGREVGRFLPYDSDGLVANAPQVWGAQPYKGHVFFSDYNSGLWAVRIGDGE
ncbi:MAG: hypothetical protein GKS06_03270 [Acidobacteria bacterium]|nr:hypothetical protein [Acidobacteriota bacterium]